ncbi:histidine kinase [Saccharopolyspora sp. K220]|uniref:sensor histidine kinase n=1 Tax=Saccharopolyspora soli TaxID=2926618 RepID=UPI001F5ABC4B|nr:histidine kinase [Saccharopolyspora soli]MCI2418179.1 histidine kinase [Saccharopolyspora soli]
MSESGSRFADRLRLFFAQVRPPTRRATVVDGALLVAALVVSVGGAIAYPVSAPEPWLPVKLAAPVVLTTMAVVLRRRFPVVSVLSAAVAAALLPPALPLLIGMSYAAGYRVARVENALAGLALAAVLYPLTSWLAYGTAYLSSDARTGLYLFLWLGMTVLLGRYRRQRRDLAVGGWERAEQLESERALVAEQARHAEQLRIARDMHDSLGHELSLIALQAGALELDKSLDPRHRELAGKLRSNTSTAMERLQDVIGLLREDTGSATTGGIDELVERATEVGVAVGLRREGDPHRVPSEAAEVVRRVVQESLTNALKHAPGSPVHIRLTYGGDRVEVEVTNPAPTPREVRSGGHGLTGLAERVRLAGGTLRTDHQVGEFRLTATIPHRSSGPAPGADRPSVDPERRTGSEASTALRRFRRRVRATVVGPLIAVALVPMGLLLFTNYLEIRDTSMPAPDYEVLRIGMAEAAVRARLPPHESPAAEQYDRLPRPTGANCLYYGQRIGFGTEGFYRLCFSSGKLIAKDVVEQ